jgi:hypothetical protein
MAPFDRFLKLEKARAGEATPSTAGATEARFGGGPLAKAPADVSPSPRSGAAVERFERVGVPEAGEAPIRLLEDDGGQSFVRCASCRADNPIGGRRCVNCEADLATRDQRAYNEAFWRRRMEEEAEQRAEVDRLREAQARAEEEAREALRRLPDLEREMRASSRRDLAIDRDGATRWLGRALGQALARAIPDRRRRIAAIVAIAALGVGTLLYVLLHTGRFGAQLAIFFVLSLAMGVLRRFLRRHGVVD